MTPTAAVEAQQRTPAQQRALKLFVVLARAAAAVTNKVHEETDLHGLTLTEFLILEALYHKGPLLLGDVQKKAMLTSGGVTYTVDRLAEKGLVERRECETDRRARWAALTGKGEKLIAEVFPAHASCIEAAVSALSAREQDEAIGLVRKLGLGAATGG